ncbi:hypothetical protein, partial [Pseudomonas aeruginosa]|uniref:hypothetical protein n=1 Tax=Pseudomonas aeruginosa TaxID=287 RepID=UPI00406C0DF0
AMTDQPQLMTEEIELIPHPMDAWRAALNALIACTPGDSAAIAVHLAEARQQALVFVDRTAATEGTRKLVDRLMLIGAGRIVGDRLQSQAAPATVASLNRRVTARMTVVVNGTDYDVSAMPGVMVGDMIRVDPNNMPPVLNREWGFDLPIPHVGAHQSRLGQVLCCGKNSAATDLPDGASAPSKPGEAPAGRQSASGSSLARPGHSQPRFDSAERPVSETTPVGHQAAPAEPQHPNQP